MEPYEQSQMLVEGFIKKYVLQRCGDEAYEDSGPSTRVKF